MSRVWPDATATLIDVLAADASINPVPAVPNPRPDEFVVVRRFGGARDPDATLDRARMSVQCWSGKPGSSQKPAWDLANEVRDLIEAAAGTVPISRWDEETVGMLPDEESGCPRVIITGSLWLRPAP